MQTIQRIAAGAITAAAIAAIPRAADERPNDVVGYVFELPNGEQVIPLNSCTRADDRAPADEVANAAEFLGEIGFKLIGEQNISSISRNFPNLLARGYSFDVDPLDLGPMLIVGGPEFDQVNGIEGARAAA